MLTLPAKLRKSFSDELLKLLVFETWFTLGGIESAANGTLASS